MTVNDLLEALENYPGDSHVILTIMPQRQMVIPLEGVKLDIKTVWRDAVGVVNIIATTEVGTIDPELRLEALGKKD